MRMGYNLRAVLENCRLLARAGFREQMSVNYSFNVIDKRPETISQTVAYHRELEQYGFEQGLIRPGYDPMSMMPWTAGKLLWNPEPLGSTFGRLCLEAFARNPGDFGRTLIDLLERVMAAPPWRRPCGRRWRGARPLRQRWVELAIKGFASRLGQPAPAGGPTSRPVLCLIGVAGVAGQGIKAAATGTASPATGGKGTY